MKMTQQELRALEIFFGQEVLFIIYSATALFLISTLILCLHPDREHLETQVFKVPAAATFIALVGGAIYLAVRFPLTTALQCWFLGLAFWFFTVVAVHCPLLARAQDAEVQARQQSSPRNVEADFRHFDHRI